MNKQMGGWVTEGKERGMGKRREGGKEGEDMKNKVEAVLSNR